VVELAALMIGFGGRSIEAALLRFNRRNAASLELLEGGEYFHGGGWWVTGIPEKHRLQYTQDFRINGFVEFPGKQAWTCHQEIGVLECEDSRT
jgi:hypothetical protein